MASFTAIWKDSGLLSSMPPFLFVPWEGLGLVYLNGARSFDIRRDLRFDRRSLSVTAVSANDVSKHLLRYTHNFPPRLFADILALAGSVLTSIRFGSVLLSVESKVAGRTASLDYVGKTTRARMDVYAAGRRTVDVAFRFVRCQDDAGRMTGGTVHAPPYAAELIDVLNRLYLPSANVELRLRGSAFADVHRQLGSPIPTEAFRHHIAPLRDAAADVTVFFVGKFKGTSDPLGQAFKDLDCVVVDDEPWQYLAPPAAWPRPMVSDEEITYAGRRLDRPRSDRDLHVVLAHEIAHILGAGHNNEPDNLMSMDRQDFRLARETVRAITGG